MLFNSFTFAWFFLIFYSIYLLLRSSYKSQNVLLLVASYVFYGWWDWRFLFLIALSTIVDFVVGQRIHRSSGSRRYHWLLVSLLVNLGLLFVFKYFDFFAESFAPLWESLGMSADSITLRLILPVGISFYTFQTLSYSIDIYKGKLTPTNSLLDFAVFVSFFPQLVAGPIERASRFLPQVCSPRTITSSKVHAGLWLILLGFFKKTVLADNLGVIADSVYGNHQAFGTADHLIATVAFMFQIYGDFSGYTDIARGLSKLLGVELAENFRLPYFATSPSDFWSRWHISLSTWLRDYLYIPLGGNRGSQFTTFRNLLLTMLLGGLWHGAAWNFVLWGVFHGAILIVYRLITKKPTEVDAANSNSSSEPVLGGLLAWLVMTCLTLFGWMLFRATSLSQVVDLLTTFDTKLSPYSLKWSVQIAFFAFPLLLLEVFQQITGNMLFVLRMKVYWQALIFGIICVFLLVFASRAPSEFLYFQF